MAVKKKTPSMVLPLAVLLLGVLAYRIQRPRLVAAVAHARLAQDSVQGRIANLRGLSHQDTTTLRRQARASEQEIAAAEAAIAPSVDIPSLMRNVDALAHRYRLTSGPLAPDTAIAVANQVATLAAPYGVETYRVTVAGTWSDVVGFVDALPENVGRIVAVPAVRSLIPARTGDGSLTADIGIAVVTQHGQPLPTAPVVPSGPIGGPTSVAIAPSTVTPTPVPPPSGMPAPVPPVR